MEERFKLDYEYKLLQLAKQHEMEIETVKEQCETETLIRLQECRQDSIEEHTNKMQEMKNTLNRTHGEEMHQTRTITKHKIESKLNSQSAGIRIQIEQEMAQKLIQTREQYERRLTDIETHNKRLKGRCKEFKSKFEELKIKVHHIYIYIYNI